MSTWICRDDEAVAPDSRDHAVATLEVIDALIARSASDVSDLITYYGALANHFVKVTLDLCFGDSECSGKLLIVTTGPDVLHASRGVAPLEPYYLSRFVSRDEHHVLAFEF